MQRLVGLTAQKRRYLELIITAVIGEEILAGGRQRIGRRSTLHRLGRGTARFHLGLGTQIGHRGFPAAEQAPAAFLSRLRARQRLLVQWAIAFGGGISRRNRRFLGQRLLDRRSLVAAQNIGFV